MKQPKTEAYSEHTVQVSRNGKPVSLSLLVIHHGADISAIPARAEQAVRDYCLGKYGNLPQATANNGIYALVEGEGNEHTDREVFALAMDFCACK